MFCRNITPQSRQKWVRVSVQYKDLVSNKIVIAKWMMLFCRGAGPLPGLVQLQPETPRCQLCSVQGNSPPCKHLKKTTGDFLAANLLLIFPLNDSQWHKVNKISLRLYKKNNSFLCEKNWSILFEKYTYFPLDMLCLVHKLCLATDLMWNIGHLFAYCRVGLNCSVQPLEFLYAQTKHNKLHYF